MWWSSLEPDADLLAQINSQTKNTYTRVYHTYDEDSDITKIAVFLDIRENGLLRIAPDGIVDKGHEMRVDVEVAGQVTDDNLLFIVVHTLDATVPMNLVDAVLFAAPGDPTFIPGKLLPREWAIEALELANEYADLESNLFAIDSPLRERVWA